MDGLLSLLLLLLYVVVLDMPRRVVEGYRRLDEKDVGVYDECIILRNENVQVGLSA